MAKIISIMNPKGGVGRTNVAINLAMMLSALSKKVLLIDLCPQGDSTYCLGIKNSPNFIGDVLLQKVRAGVTIRSTPYFGFNIIPSFNKLNQTIKELNEIRKSENRLKKALEDLKEEYDFIIIDTASGFNILHKNAINASDEILVPTQCQSLALRQVLDFNKRFKNISIVFTMYGWRSKLSRKVVKEVRNNFNGLIYNTLIPKAEILGETTQPIFKELPNSRAARAYKQLAEEVVGKN